MPHLTNRQQMVLFQLFVDDIITCADAEDIAADAIAWDLLERYDRHEITQPLAHIAEYNPRTGDRYQ